MLWVEYTEYIIFAANYKVSIQKKFEDFVIAWSFTTECLDPSSGFSRHSAASQCFSILSNQVYRKYFFRRFDIHLQFLQRKVRICTQVELKHLRELGQTNKPERKYHIKRANNRCERNHRLSLKWLKRLCKQTKKQRLPSFFPKKLITSV